MAGLEDGSIAAEKRAEADILGSILFTLRNVLYEWRMAVLSEAVKNSVE